jgi:hypothetical protein
VIEWFCPVHGIPALIGWFIGVDPRIFLLTFRLQYDRLVSLFK